MATTLTIKPATTSATAPTIDVEPGAKDGQYPAMAENKKPGCRLQIRESTDLVFLAYALKSEKLAEFQEFYKKNIESWMKHRGVKHAHAYVTGNTFVVLASIQADVPWIAESDRLSINPTGPIDGFEDYLAKEQPEVIKLPVFSNPAPK